MPFVRPSDVITCPQLIVRTVRFLRIISILPLLATNSTLNLGLSRASTIWRLILPRRSWLRPRARPRQEKFWS
jgi:hypothetical protein